MKCYLKVTRGEMTSALYSHNIKQGKWESKRCVLELVGSRGSRKTSFVLDYFSSKRHFYFSFQGLDEPMARKLLAGRLEAIATSWTGIFSALNDMAMHTNIILFDDMDDIVTDKIFSAALQAYIDDPARRKVFLVLVHNKNTKLDTLELISHTIAVPYCSIAEIKKSCPERTGQEALLLYTLSGGIPEIVNSFDDQSSIQENLRRMLCNKSPLLCFAEETLAHHFRRPEGYAMILYALATGHTRISEIGGFTDFAYNKCDKYIKALIACGLVQKEKIKAESGVEKTSYKISNPYYQNWFEYIYPNRDRIVLGTFSEWFLANALPKIVDEYLEYKYIAACFRAVHGRLDTYLPIAIRDMVAYNPYRIAKDNFDYTFDCFAKSGRQAVFVKIFHGEHEIVGREHLAELERAIALCHRYVDSHIYLFSKRRFGDYAVHDASVTPVKLFTVERLKF
ncbi:MAG: hypothetical protein RSF33_02705 [Hydrogenoanaerobacterium sp.]